MLGYYGTEESTTIMEILGKFGWLLALTGVTLEGCSKLHRQVD